MGFRLFLCLFIACFCGVSSQEHLNATIVVKGGSKIAQTDEHFVCATIDWWPPEKCNYNDCPWHRSTALTLNLSHPLLAKAIQGFDHLRIRIGGSVQDQVVYDVGALKYPCHPFQKTEDGLFGFSKGCLHMDRWDALNHLLSKSGGSAGRVVEYFRTIGYTPGAEKIDCLLNFNEN